MLQSNQKKEKSKKHVRKSAQHKSGNKERKINANKAWFSEIDKISTPEARLLGIRSREAQVPRRGDRKPRCAQKVIRMYYEQGGPLNLTAWTEGVHSLEDNSHPSATEKKSTRAQVSSLNGIGIYEPSHKEDSRLQMASLISATRTRKTNSTSSKIFLQS